ncbi:glycoside hydrolase family 28 protein [Ramaria rubella]|nr:glycoside hydrolase family 28 protein [Ramaria rubella]
MVLITPIGHFASLLALAILAGRSSAATCNVVPTGGDDDHDAILKALTKCANKGTVHFGAGNAYTLASPITSDESDALGLSNTQIIIDGNINYAYQKVGGGDQDDTVYWTISGTNVDISGTGTIKGHGEQWYNVQQRGPKLMELKADQGSLSDLTFQNGGSHMIIVGGNDFVVKNLTIHSISNDYNNAYPQNATDNSTTLILPFAILLTIFSIQVKNTDIIGGDDCVSFLDKADTIHINNVKCGGPTHGISVGALGSSTGGNKEGTVKNVLIENIEFYDGGLAEDWPDFTAPQFVARIKTYGNPGSTGTVSNVTWQHITVTSDLGISASGKTAVYVTQNHNVANGEQDPAHSGISITDITFSDISGGKIPNADTFGSVSITCSADHHCHNILIEDINFKGAPEEHCTNASGLDKNCVDCGGC